jgi:hypothetical protein
MFAGGRAMDSNGLTDEDIRQRAYDLWEEWGRPHAAGDKFWLLAEQELVHDKSNGERDIVSENPE